MHPACNPVCAQHPATLCIPGALRAARRPPRPDQRLVVVAGHPPPFTTPPLPPTPTLTPTPALTQIPTLAPPDPSP
eukprot:scaffold26413_cov33-Phaeocystis_antarctica.AAC.2